MFEAKDSDALTTMGWLLAHEIDNEWRRKAGRFLDALAENRRAELVKIMQADRKRKGVTE